MKMFSDCSGPCETCRVHNSGAMCLAGHGDDDYTYASPEWIVEYREEKEERLRKWKKFVERYRLLPRRPVV